MAGFNKGKENNYHENRKESRIFTPRIISKRIHDIYITLKNNKSSHYSILDICSGEWSLSKPFADYYNVSIYGLDIQEPKTYLQNSRFLKVDFLKEGKINDFIPNLILCNPPFNNKDGGKLLLPFEFLKKILTEYPNAPLVLFAPHGILNNNEIFGKKYKQKVTDAENDNALPRYAWMQKHIHKLSSMLILPKDAFVENRYMGIIKKKVKGEEIEVEVEKGILVHSFVTFWNMPNLEPFYTL